MSDQIHCKNCRNQISNDFCMFCGQKSGVGRLNPEALFEEIISLYFNSSAGLYFTIKQMIFYPGKSMLGYIDGARKKYQSPISYFACSIVIYFLFGKFALGSQRKLIGNGITMDLNHLFILMIGMSLIGWFFSGIKWRKSDKRSFNFIESVVVFSYIYGTNFFIAPIVILIELPFWRDITRIVGESNMKLTTDLPLIILIAYMAFDFCKTAKISIYRYLLTLIVGFLYYRYMSDYIELITNSYH